MNVTSVAVFDNIFDVDTYRSAIDKANLEANANLSQLAAVAAICNVAQFEGGTNNEKEPGVVGDATGEHGVYFHKHCP